MKRLTTIGVSLLACGALMGAGARAEAVELKLTEVPGATFPERGFVLTLPQSAALSAKDVEVRENGQRVEGLQVTTGASAGADAFGVVLAVDASESMRGGAIEDAIAAARAFVERRRPEQKVGILFFSREPRVALPLTTDPAKLEQTLAQVPALSKGTQIYDAGTSATRLLSDAGIRAGSIVILSDGADAGSEATEASLAAAAKKIGARIFTVGLRSPSADLAALQSLGEAASGSYSEAGKRGDLKAIFTALGSQLASEYLVSYRSLVPEATAVTVEARVADLDAAGAATYVTPKIVAAGTTLGGSGGWASAPAIAGIALLVAILLAAAVMLIVRGPRQTAADRIQVYTGAPKPASPFDIFNTDRRGGVRSRFEKGLGKSAWWPKFAEQVEIAGFGIAPSQLAGLTAAVTLTMVWVALLTGRGVAAVLLALTPLFVTGWVRATVAKRRREFVDQLPDNLQVVASALRAGQSFEGGLAVAAEDAPEPARSEFRRIVSDERLGVPLREAMAGVARRMRSREFDQVSVVVELQRETGGNTAEILDRVVESLRYRGELRALVRSLTAQGRMGGIIVTALPVVMALILSLILPGYFDPMLQTGAGKALIVVGVVMVTVAWLIIRKIIDIKV